MIRVGEQNSYVVDFFRIFGGEDHIFSFHGGTADEVTAEGLSLTRQEGGTYAGENVERPEPAQNSAYNREVGNGFNYLYNVERDEDPGAAFSVEWRLRDQWNVLPEDRREGIRLRLTMLTELDDVALADGPMSLRPGNPESFKFLLARRSGENLRTIYTSVIEPYRDDRFLGETEQVAVRNAADEPVEESEVRAVRVKLADGRVDYIVTALDPDQTYRVGDSFQFQGALAFLRTDARGQPLRAYVHNGKGLVAGKPLITGRTPRVEGIVVDFTREMTTENYLVVRAEGVADHADDLPGRWAYVANDNWRNGAYKIEDVEVEAPDQVRLFLGNTTLIREFQDPEDFDAGYIYNIEEGAGVRIPLAAHWTAEAE